MSRYYKSKKKKIFLGIVISVLTIGTLIGIGFILDKTLPVAHDFFVNTIDWFKNLFSNTNTEEIETPVACVTKFISRG